MENRNRLMKTWADVSACVPSGRWWVRALPMGLTLCLLACPLSGVSVAADGPRNFASADPLLTDADYPFQGEYLGDFVMDGEKVRLGMQVVALGDGEFDVVAYPGGLPGAGWQGAEKFSGKGKREGTGKDTKVAVTVTGPDGSARKGEIRDNALISLSDSGAEQARFPKVHRQSPTLGKQAPQGAVVLFDGITTNAFPGSKTTHDCLLKQGITSADSFGDGQWHIEFRLPYQPKDRGQGRGNSGAYIQGAYEVQMLDSFGLKGENNECGGVYSVAAPRTNMCFPPLEWQTYDIDFTAPRYDGEKQVSAARMTVRHNGVLIHNNVEVPTITPGGTKADGPRTVGPLPLQDHGNPVRYRNIWVVPKS